MSKHNYGKVVSIQMDLNNEYEARAFDAHMARVEKALIRKYGSLEAANAARKGMNVGYRQSIAHRG